MGLADSGYGCIFSIHTDGSNYKVIHYFALSGTEGEYPLGSLTVSGNKLYGTTAGDDGNGNIFSMDTNGSVYKDLLDFNGLNGWEDLGNLTLVGGVLYGSTTEGGASFGSGGGYGYGCIFSIDTDGSKYKDLFDFNEYDASPGNVIYSGGLLFGATTIGGKDSVGFIFSIDTNGSGFRELFDFNDTNGKYGGTLLISGNHLYGTSGGGKYNEGVIFSIDTNGSSYKKLFDFNNLDGEGATGLIFSGKTLYGTARGGGIYRSGVIFSIDTLGCTNTYDQTICIVTTDTTINRNIIIWGRNDSPPDGYYNIYDSTVSGWNILATVFDTALSEYIDTASRPSTQSYSYRISTVDSCGESALSPMNSTIYLQVLQEFSGRDSLYWTPYIGFVTPYYLIYRGLSLKTLKLIDSVSGSVETFVDTLPPAGSIYLVEAINPFGGCTPTHKHITHGSSTSTFASLSNGGIPKKVTGIENIVYPKNTVIISPNPNNGWFTLQTTNIKSKSRIDVYNMFGEKIYTQELNKANTEVDIGNNSSGIYLYRVITEGGDLISEGKFIKE